MYKNKFSFLFGLLLSIFIISCKYENQKSGIENSVTTEQAGSVTYLSAEEFQEKSINQLIVDIRTPFEFNMGHIEGAININYYSPNFSEEIAKLERSKPVFIYCRSGNRTSSASKIFLQVGFSEVFDLNGGINMWNRANYKTIK